MLSKINQFVKDRVRQSRTKVKMKAKAFIDEQLKVETKVKAKAFIDKYQGDIILVIGVILISLLSFATGYIVAKEQTKQPLEFYEGSYYRGGNQWTVSRLEIV